ncbi:MAG: SPOR domain-containing protein [Candidatus Omnitrophota bacterium]
MIFGFKSNKSAQDKGSLTENDIRSRLYGGAVAVSDDMSKKRRFDDFPKKAEPKKRVIVEDALNEEQLRLLQDLRALHLELEQTKKRLKKMHSLKKRTAMFLFLRLLTFVIVSAVLFLAFSKFFINRGHKPSRPTTSIANINSVRNIDLVMEKDEVVAKNVEVIKPITPSKPVSLPVVKNPITAANYTIQIAVYAGRTDAERFRQGIAAKGYEVFIRKSVYKSSGKPKYIVCVGRFLNKDGASDTLDKLREQEKITDSFVLSMKKD